MKVYVPLNQKTKPIIYKYVFTCVFIFYVYSVQGWGGGLKSSYEHVIFAVDDFFYPWDPSTATLLEEVCGLQGDYVEK